MATLTIRQLDNQLKERLRIRAAHHQRSMEAEARAILGNTLQPEATISIGLGSAIHALFKNQSVELEMPQRTMPKPAPDFS